MMEVRLADVDDVQLMLDWAAAEGWNPGLDDARAFHAADPGGFFLGCLDDRPIASISVVNHNPGFAFLGLYIVRPEFRGRGHGKTLWDVAMAHAGDRIVALDGVPDQQENYKRSGFVRAGSTARYAGTWSGRLSDVIRPARPEEMAALIRTEHKSSGQEKTAYLQAWYEGSSNRQTLVLPGDDRPLGHATLRKCVEGFKIGPLHAETSDIAEALLDHSFALAGGWASIDVPQSAKPLGALCEARGLSVGFETARMYTAPVHEPRSDFFAVTSLELG